MTNVANFDGMTCPAARNNYERVLLGHGSGGKLSADLIQQVFLAGLVDTPPLEDSATVPIDLQCSGLGNDRSAPEIAFTTDSYVIKPLFFPGGDIGKLAVNGTVNDLAMAGAKPLCLSTAFILEEGFEIGQLRRIVGSIREACRLAGVNLVTGDTKVVDRGKGDQVFITTTGVGTFVRDCRLSIKNARPGDRVIVSGTIGDHGIAIMSTREGIEFETELESDTAPLHELTQLMLDYCPSIRWMRDPTRGGLSSTLNELALEAGVGIELDEKSIPVRPEVHSACEMLGLDPLFVANEGKLVAVVPESETEGLLDVMRSHPLGQNAAIIGEVVQDHAPMVVMRTVMGGQRVVMMLAGEQLPRIC